MVYPYSNLLPRVKEIYEWYIYTYFYGDSHDPNFQYDSFLMKDEILQEYENTIAKYEYTTFADIIRDFMGWLKENGNIINDDIREKLNERLN